MSISIKQKRASKVRYTLKKRNKDRLRMSIFKSAKNLYVQVIDDVASKTICSASSLASSKKKNGCNIESAKSLGSTIAKLAKEKGIDKVYLDRGPNIYHGIIKTLADEARSAGLTI
jgi:large subunit ribosomal protein L18